MCIEICYFSYDYEASYIYSVVCTEIFVLYIHCYLPCNTLDEIPSMNVSYKPQKISPKFTGTVVQLLHTKIRDSYVHPQFTTDVIKPLQVDKLFDQEVLNLSGGELQRVALTLCLGQVRREGEIV